MTGYQEGMSSIDAQPFTPEFIGREDLIFSLHSHFLKSKPSLSQGKQKRYLLWGLGGSGKTQTALEFAVQFKEQ